MSVCFNRKKGFWAYDFLHNKKRYTGSGFNTKRDAQREEAQRREEVIYQTKTPVTAETPIGMDFLDLCNRRLDYCRGYHTERHFQQTLCYAKRWVRQWGHLNCESINRSMIQAYILKRGKVTASGANMELRLLRALFNFGLNAELIASNPAAKIPFLPEAKSRRRHPPPKEDLIKVISVADPDTQDYLWALAFTAARVGEINALTWEDVDFERRLVTLWTRKRKNSNREPRDVPMVPNLYEILKSRYEQRNPNMPWVFWHTCYSSKKKQKVSGPYGDRKRVLATLCKKADVPYFSFHPIRHLTASLLDDLGVTMGVIQKILGHKNRRTTEIYLHSIGDSARRAMGLLGEQAFPGAASSNPEVPRNMPREYYQRKVERPSLEQLKKDIGNLGFVGTGKKYGVSDNAVRKWLRLELEPVNTADFLSSEKKSQSNSQSKEKRVNPERLTP